MLVRLWVGHSLRYRHVRIPVRVTRRDRVSDSRLRQRPTGPLDNGIGSFLVRGVDLLGRSHMTVLIGAGVAAIASNT